VKGTFIVSLSIASPSGKGVQRSKLHPWNNVVLSFLASSDLLPGKGMFVMKRGGTILWVGMTARTRSIGFDGRVYRRIDFRQRLKPTIFV